MQCVELHPRRIIQRYRREVADRGAQRVHAGDDPELRQQREPKHQADQYVPRGKDVRGSVCETAVDQRTSQEDYTRDDGDPVQFAESASHNVAGQMRIGQNLKCSGCKNESEENQTPNPGHEREQHQEAKKGHDAEL